MTNQGDGWARLRGVSFTADLHLHSPYAMGVSRAISLETLAWWAGVKGLDALACGDFTHPAWLAELRRKLRPAGDGLFALREGEASGLPERLPAEEGRDGTPFPAAGGGSGTRFVLGTEASCVYPQGGRTRRAHLLVLAPDFAAVDGLCKAFAPFGALESDGRPTLRLSGRDVVDAALTVSPLCEVIPAHVWTPWYGVYGSKGGFDALDECFGDMTPHIHAVETGLSSDPAMNWRVPELDGRTLVSFSDAHSAPRLGREFTVFAGAPGYGAIIEGLRTGRIEWTGEFHPQEGKYYYDGHRKCGVSAGPEEAGDGRCPACGRPMTRGVLGRVNSVASRAAPEGNGERDASGERRGQGRAEGERPPFRRLVPLEEIIAEARGRRVGSKGVREAYFRLIERAGPELRVLTEADAAEIEAASDGRIAEGVLRARTGALSVEPGFDGQYGVVRIWGSDGAPSVGGQ